MEGFSHGADDYLVKPFSPRELLMRVAVQLKLRRLTAQVANAARLAAVGTPAAGVAHEIKTPQRHQHRAAARSRRGEITPAGRSWRPEIEECRPHLRDHHRRPSTRPADVQACPCSISKPGDETLRLLSDRLRNKVASRWSATTSASG